jgi:hypothetical protein
MRKLMMMLAACLWAFAAAAAQAQGVNWDKVDAALGRKAAVAGDVHSY